MNTEYCVLFKNLELSLKNNKLPKLLRKISKTTKVKPGVCFPKFVLEALPDTEESRAFEKAAETIEKFGLK